MDHLTQSVNMQAASFISDKEKTEQYEISEGNDKYKFGKILFNNMMDKGIICIDKEKPAGALPVKIGKRGVFMLSIHM